VRAATLLLALAGTVVLSVAAAAQAAPTLAERHDFEPRSARFDLPGRLVEISGLAVTPDGRLFAHDDERAMVHELHPGEGRVGKRFALGDPPVAGDFEGIAVVAERFFLVTSRGLLYEFREMADGGEAPYRVTDTEIGADCEIEGLDYDPRDEVLLFACKVSASEQGTIVVHRMPLDPDRARPAPLRVARAELEAYGVPTDFAPSAVAVDATGTLVLLSATADALIEVDRSGRVLSGVRLSSDRHRQPEGLAFGPDGTLYVADEGAGRDARVTAYARVR
jgi:uncharacterized protein YjiK